MEKKTKTRCQVGNKAMKTNLTNLLRGKGRNKRKKEQICKVKQRQIYISTFINRQRFIYLEITSKGKRTVGNENKGINNNKFKKLKLKKNKDKKKKKKKKKKERKENSTGLQKPNGEKRFITKIKSD